MSYLVGIILTIIALMISVAFHELGHMIPAKKFGVYVPQYMVGFGPTLFSRTIGETEYGIKAILLGGYVRLAGMFPPARDGIPTHNRKGRLTLAEEARRSSAEELPEGREHQAFYNLSVPKKLTVMLGGPVVNLLMSIVIFAIIILGIGFNKPSTTLEYVPYCIGDEVCSDTHPTSPAYEAGLRAGDTITSWGGTPVDTWSDVVAHIEAGGTTPADVVVERNGKTLSFTVTPTLIGGHPKAGIISAVQRVSGTPSDVIDISWRTFTGTASIVMVLPKAVWDTAASLFKDEPRDPNSVLSVVGVGRIAGEVSSTTSSASNTKDISMVDRAVLLLSLWASLNMALFVFNLIPLPPLDGGHVAGALWEGIRRSYNRIAGRPDPGAADTARMMPLTYTMVTLLLGMTVILVIADVVKPIHLL
ncbi:MAG: site-2 protease family protein [Actinomycetaceae bacterium]|nr:site-2 protease family protein [Actinomycetaceae bacterium]